MRLSVIPRLHRATHAIALSLASHPQLETSQAEAHVLAHLHESHEARIAELHERFGHRRSTLTSVLDRLEGRKLIRRTTDPSDRRSFIVTLTKAGRAAAAAVHRMLAALEKAALERFTERERQALADALDAIAQASHRTEN